MTPSGLEPTSAGDGPPSKGSGRLVCPKCRHVFDAPPIARPVARVQALTPAHGEPINRAAELEDATPTQPHQVDRRLADTERIESSD